MAVGEGLNLLDSWSRFKCQLRQRGEIREGLWGQPPSGNRALRPFRKLEHILRLIFASMIFFPALQARTLTKQNSPHRLHVDFMRTFRSSSYVSSC